MEAIDALDHAAMDWLHEHGHDAFLTPVMRALSNAWAFSWLIVGIAVWLVWKGGDKGRILLLTSLLLVLLVDQVAASIIKPLVARPRPFGGGSSYSFPSVHAADIAAQATLFARFYPKITVAFAVMALLVGYSRIYLEKHYPSDVLGGYLLGITLGALAAWAALRWGNDVLLKIKNKWAQSRRTTS